eukprot:Phypoly_transcript_14692.p1 GENE.Phypoly_transcript_14692~~Phypoly_transcript_14692.p1  ORF type:complete len:277 (+),score=14.31 Phypoly_transcript_14692:76-906(+)
MEQFFSDLFDSHLIYVQNREAPMMKCATTTKAKDDGGYRRASLPLFGPDPMHAHLQSIGEEPAFPDKDDIPADSRFSFDVYYLFANAKFNRVTITRAHRISSVYHVCFVNGNVVWACSPKYGYLLIDQHEWHSAFESAYPYCFSFHIGQTKIYVSANSGLNAHAKVWQLPISRHPLYWGIFVNNQNTVSGRTVAEDNLVGKLCPATLYLFFLLPFWVLWVLFSSFCLNPLFYYGRTCKVRRYFIEGGEEGTVRQRELMGHEYSIEQASLLGSIHPQ